ncbi:aldehyde dehydrogenase domain protein [Mycobacterium intracellulare]|nr:aldehyde dehydrogenase domain protein [Mycobacterium intracellulare]
MTKNSDHRCYDEVFIGGQWRKPANPQQLEVISPHSEEPVGHVQAAGPRTSTPPLSPLGTPSTTDRGRG